MCRFSPQFVRTLALAIVFAGCSATGLAQERFVLKVPGRNDLTSTAVQNRDQLVINDWQNQTFVYERFPRLDTPDGRYLGYFSRAAGQALRWPADDSGSMLIGDADGRNWRQSQQNIHAGNPARAGQPNVVTTRKPVIDQLGRDLQEPQLREQDRRQSLPMEVAYTRAGEKSLDVGYIGPRGDLQLYRGYRDQWKPQEFANADQWKNAGLVPGAPLQLVSRRGQDLPAAYTVNTQGQLVEIADGEVRPVANNVPLAPRSHFHVRQANEGLGGYAVDSQGRLWDFDLATGRQQLIDQTAGRFAAGAPISVVSQNIRGGLRDNLFLVDQRGLVQNYSLANGVWQGPNQVAAGFPPGAPLASTMGQFGGGRQIRLAGVDARGQVQTLGQTHAGWQALPVQGATLAPGSPLTFTQTGPDLSLSGIGPGGVWQHWDNQSRGWNQSIVSRGFLSGAPVVADPFSQTAFSVDATGRLVTGGYWDNDWHSHLLLPGVDYASPLVRRQITGNRGLAPATVFFDNHSQEELVVQMVDQFGGQPPVQFNIPPNGSVPQQIRRDGGGSLEEAYLVPDGFGGWVEQVQSFPLPPQPGPTVVAWAKRVTYSYIDPKNISVVGDFDLKNNVSLGVFELPPGEFLDSGDRFDVYREAASRWNPGAAQYFGPPIPDRDVGTRLYRDYGTDTQPLPPNNVPQAEPQPRQSDPESPDLPPLPSPRTREPPPDENENSEDGPVLPPLPE